ncbi:hypothetical protein A7A08_03043 [Methyloligella halotolerans]|uniref:Peptidase S74 domain-containing protein n=1 Tax=Methyloligella halotolerans TaxID=1177755 RepID=A0A1E2RVF1_9HYPH|nr:tail fiber domain-containing protein [Methyloligella halotolerans]ODA66029.1 hypothetical protein A7A08_03043 [Methyloligella halotolerans]
MKRIAVLLVLGLAGAAVAWAQDWGSFTTISSTLGVNANRLCIGEGSRPTDIGCPSYTPTVDATGLLRTGNVSVTGNVSATGTISADRFVGDGSELTGVIAASGDRITSGTTGMVAISETGYISITTGGVTTGYFTPGGVLVANGISVATDRMSATTGYFSGKVGIGTKSPSATLHVSGTISATDAIQVGTSGLECSSAVSGTIRFSHVGDTLQVCTGEGWKSLVSGTIATALADLTDVEVSGSVAGSYLRFDGSNWVTSTTEAIEIPATDRITSGTTAIIANSATSYVSLSSGGTSWGYLGQGASYLPRLTIGAELAAGKVSSSNISSTYVQLSSATTTLSCNAGATGTMRYTSGTMQVCDGTDWSNIGIGVPTGTIAAFARSSCPTGWSEYTPSRGRFLRGIDNGAGNDPDWPRSAGSIQEDTLQNVAGGFNLGNGMRVNGASGPFSLSNSTNNGGPTASNGGYRSVNFDLSDAARTSSETRPKNVAVTFCQYNGYGSEIGSAGVAALASLSDVSVGGATNGQVLTYSGGTWIPSDTAATVLAIDDLSDVETSGASAGSYLRFDGSNWVTSTTEAIEIPDTDRITSGTTAIIVNSATSYVSFSSGGTSWGYLGQGASYLPRMAIGTDLTADTISATNISGTYVQLSSATAVLTCNAGATGTMRYTSGTMQVCDGSDWRNIGIGVPTGIIAAFARSSCPTGWSEYTPSRGRFLRGIDNGAGNDPDGTREPGDTQGDAAPNITGSLASGSARPVFLSVGGAFKSLNGGSGGSFEPGGSGTRYSTANFDASKSSSKYGAADEIRPKNVAVTFCQYNGYGSEIGTAGAAALASLSDVSVGGATDGQVLTYSGGTWIASDTAAIVSALDDLTDVDTSGASIGSYLRFDGSSWVISTTDAVQIPDADRITSGTTAIIANSATSYVSLSSGGTSWGYLGQGASYLPRLTVGADLTAGKVSSTNISGTYVQLSSATTPLVCATGATGTMRYTSGTMQVCDGTDWSNIGIGVPTGTIAAFARSSCPTGWSEYTPSRGRFLRGIDNGAGNDPDGTRLPGSVQADEFRSHRHNMSFEGGDEFSTVTASPAGRRAATSPGPQVQPAGGDETRPKNVAVTFCRYNGYGSQLSTGVATLASLSDVNIGGAIAGQALVFDGASWVPSATTGGSGGASGNDTEVQFNDGGSTLGGDSTFTYDKNAGLLTVGTVSTALVSGTTLYIAGNIRYGGQLTDASDKRLKTDIKPLERRSLDKLLKLRPVSFRMNGEGTSIELGFIAQDVQPVFPDLVATEADEVGTKSLNYIGLIAPIVKAIQELREWVLTIVADLRIEDRKLRAEHQDLREQIETLRVELKAAKENIDALRFRINAARCASAAGH